MIDVLLDDLAGIPVDAVLRPADGLLGPATPGMLRLDQQAGPRFDALRRVTLPFDAGAAVVTGGGDLAAPFVVHVIVKQGDGPASPDRVRRALVSAWQRAAEWNLDSVAAPLVGAGSPFSAEESAALLVETFDARPAGTAPSTLTIVVERPEELVAVWALIRRAQ
jgi:O-acetyl-ADP-ribose deacetylase (regulator of RNase III)